MSRLAAIHLSLHATRALTLRLTEDLDDAALRMQADDELSPIGWHLGHVAWTEELWLQRGGSLLPARDDDALYSSFASAKRERGGRIPAGAEIRKRAAAIRARTEERLARLDLDDPKIAWAVGFLAGHEKQHAETIAMARLAAGLALARSPAPLQRLHPISADWIDVPGGAFTLGAADDPDAWDNEREAHAVELRPFSIARIVVTCGAWKEFIDAGGYADDRLWSPEGLAWRDAVQARAPRHWIARGDHFVRRTLAGERPLDRSHPVSHVSRHEAEAYARFADARLPTEAEWEAAASMDAAGNKRRFPWGNDARAVANLDFIAGDTTPVGSRPEAASALGLDEPCGNVWEWTASAFAPYPGFRSDPYEGYSAPWFDGRHAVLRGGAWCTQTPIARTTFRNWFDPGFRLWPSGLRLARDR